MAAVCGGGDNHPGCGSREGKWWEFLQSFLPYIKHWDLAAAWFAKARKDMASLWLLQVVGSLS